MSKWANPVNSNGTSGMRKQSIDLLAAAKPLQALTNPDLTNAKCSGFCYV
jgi:hypothetical protein